MKEVDRSWDKDSEDIYYVNDKKVVVHGETVTVPDEFAEAIEASRVKYPEREVPASPAEYSIQASKTATENGTVLPDEGYDALAQVVVNVSGGVETPKLTLGYTFSNNKASNAYGSVTITSYDSEHDGNYDLYWANDDGILSNYTKLNMLTTLAVNHSGIATVFDKFNQYNAIPKYATKLVAVLASDENKVIKASFNIPSSKLWQSGDFGNHIGSEGELADVHYQYDTGSDDWATAFTYLDQRESVKAINIAGDLTSHGTLEHLTQWKTARDTYAVDTPVYACNGNHESYNESAYMVTNPTLMRPFLDTDYVDETVNYFTKTINGIVHVYVPIFEGVEQDDRNTMFSSTVLDWLEEVLEDHRNERVILYAHCPPQKGEHPYGFADGDGMYDTRKMWGYGGVNTMQDRKDFLDLLKHYKNVFWVSGHTHLKYMYQEQYSNLNIVRFNTDGAHFIHTSSLTVPRDIIDGSITGYIYADSEGTILDVYDRCLRFRTRNFVDEKFYGLGEYVIDDAVVTIPAKTKVLDSISATKTTTTYNVGDSLDTSDIVTTATFTDESSQAVQGTYDTSDVNMLVAGTYSIEISYTFNGVTKTATVSITVVDTQTKALSSISASKTNVSYSVGDTLSTSDISVTATYTDSTSADVSSSSSVVIDTSNVDMSTAGTYNIGVSYTEDGVTKTATISITVSASSGSIPLGTIVNNTKLNHDVGQALTITANQNKYFYYEITGFSAGTYKLEVATTVASDVVGMLMCTDSSDVITKKSSNVTASSPSQTLTVASSDARMFVRGYESHGSMTDREAFTLTKIS